MYGREFYRWERTYVKDSRKLNCQRREDNGCFVSRDISFGYTEHDQLDILEECLWDKEEEGAE